MILKLSASLVTQPKFMVPRHRLLTSAPCAPRTSVLHRHSVVSFCSTAPGTSQQVARARRPPERQRLRTSESRRDVDRLPVLKVTLIAEFRAL